VLVPSQVLVARRKDDHRPPAPGEQPLSTPTTPDDDDPGDVPVLVPFAPSQPRAREAGSPPKAEEISIEPPPPPPAPSPRERSGGGGHIKGSRHGEVANPAWRAVSWEDLRAHPAFEPLPWPDDVAALTPTDLRLYRQDSWQWDALHAGRLTTSYVASVLGFYEPASASLLGVPRRYNSSGSQLAIWLTRKQEQP
jgi:hypothetical protein